LPATNSVFVKVSDMLGGFTIQSLPVDIYYDSQVFQNDEYDYFIEVIR